MKKIARSFSGWPGVFWLLAVSLCSAMPHVSGWLVGDAHLHSTYSDGNSSIAVMASRAKDLGLQWLYLTDHAPFFFLKSWNNYVRECRQASTDIIVMAGSEFGLTNHYLGYGLEHFQPSLIDSCQGLINYVISLGGFGYIAHPDSPDLGWDDLSVDGYTGIEVWNGRSSCEYLWDELLMQQRKVLGIANTDAHSPDSLGDPFLYVRAGPAEEEILQALKTGKVVMSRGPFLNFEVGPSELGETAGIPERSGVAHLNVTWVSDGTLELVRILRVDPDGISTAAIIDTVLSPSPVELTVPLEKNSICLRLQGLNSSGQVIALTNPIWVQELA
ncbi:MAG TPA: CehA/McbA family metallohydrolase, partial [bacterium]|nr:CehA/McbA family metallohydrolase [bacterium]